MDDEPLTPEEVIGITSGLTVEVEPLAKGDIDWCVLWGGADGLSMLSILSNSSLLALCMSRSFDCLAGGGCLLAPTGLD